jgi:hypothetical protein
MGMISNKHKFNDYLNFGLYKKLNLESKNIVTQEFSKVKSNLDVKLFSIINSKLILKNKKIYKKPIDFKLKFFGIFNFIEFVKKMPLNFILEKLKYDNKENNELRNYFSNTNLINELEKIKK